jgi:integrase
MQQSWLREFTADWQLDGKALRTAVEYCRYLQQLHSYYKNPSLAEVKEWLQNPPGASVRRKKAQSVRALGRWCQDAGIDYFSFWKQVPLVTEQVTPQATVTDEIYRQVLSRCVSVRDKALVELLWSTGLRRAEIERLRVEHIDFAGSFIVVAVSKTKRPRVVPLSPTASRALRRQIGKQETGSVFKMTGTAIWCSLQKLEAPSAHAWRRGWAVHSLRNGVSETSLKSAAGWSSGAMVSRYTSALSSELALDEFHASWARSGRSKP